MKTIRTLVAGAALLPASLSVFAQTTDKIPEEIFVTATRTSELFADVIGAVSSVSRDEIEASGALDLHDLLRSQAGIDIVRSGPSGAQTSVFMRGSESDHVLVLIDGVRVNAPTSGGALWGEIPLEQIERVEIVRGPRSAQFGSDAIGGVIQLFTRDANDLSIAIKGGSYASKEATISGGYSGELINASLVIAQGETDGFSATNDGAFNFNPDDDGREYKNASAKLSSDLSRNLSVGASWLYNQQDAEIDSAGEQLSRARQLGAWAKLSNAESSELTINASQLQQEIADIVATRRQAGVQTNLNLKQAGTLTIGYEFSEDHGIDPGAYDEQSSLRSLYLQQQFSVQGFDAVLAARRDTHSRFGGHNTGSVSLARWFGEHRVFATYGSGFKAPNLSDLFSPAFDCGVPCFGGNPDLKPERSRSAELGLDLLLGEADQLQITVFKTEIEDLVVTGFSGAENVGESDIQGVEITLTQLVASFQVDISATWQQARKANGDQLLRRPDRKGSLKIRRDWENFNAGLEILASGKHRDFVGNVEGDVAGYALVNASANYRISSRLKLNLRAENLGDVFYQTAFGFNNPGRSGYLTAQWQLL